MSAWERCGNTPYYRRPSGPGWFYVNPFNWSQVSISVEMTGLWAGSSMILYRKAPRYDWPAIKNGIHFVAKEKEEQTKYLKATHGWANDLMRAKTMGLPLGELRRIFHGAPEDERDRVLEGVGALLQGYENADIEALHENPATRVENGIVDITLMAVGKDRPAYQNLEELQNAFPEEKFFVANTLELAIEEALGYLGIHEC